MDWNFLCGEPSNSTNWFSVHCSSPPQHCAALCGQVLLYALSLVCNKNNKNTVDSVNQLCGEAQLTGSLCTGATALHRIVQHLARTLWTLRCGMLCTNSVEQAQVYFVEQQLSSTLWCAAGPTTHSLDTETLDREGPIFMVMCHFWHRGTDWGIRICCFSTKGFQQSQGTEIF